LRLASQTEGGTPSEITILYNKQLRLLTISLPECIINSKGNSPECLSYQREKSESDGSPEVAPTLPLQARTHRFLAGQMAWKEWILWNKGTLPCQHQLQQYQVRNMSTRQATENCQPSQARREQVTR